MLLGTCLEEAKLLLVKTQKFGQSLQSLLPTVKGMGFANIRGSGPVLLQLSFLGSYRMGGTHQSRREESEGRSKGSYRWIHGSPGSS